MLKRFRGRVVGVLALAAVFIVSSFGYALAQSAPDEDAVAAVDGGAVILKDTLVEIATTVLPYAVAVLAILLGWRMARRFVKA